ncbi:alpha-amylase family glycosyl hydrolase [Lachnoclostridium phytofermentans]|uniref:Alpha-amylase n=1 Tax=Lachnoclostridium phytofermentans (strain ATCC 700394 / DSM 18823 / ISDg) TaxID=357809 RepID=A9KKX3_LACP7|nr:alpha-amylase family glycosyl hydrolase [Lachnoclostridium phytofermentans]ABX42705.1 alpha amylase catalytic region [Lachnoclostridium phytofermentans ISDg]
MRKKILLLSCLIIVLLAASACKKADVNQNPSELNQDESQKEKEENDDEGTPEVSQDETKAVIPYDYVQNLNIIDDNYRNFYEIFVYSFYDSNGDGIGDINGVISKLDYINDGNDATDSDLGFNGIWLMPIMPSTTYHKYDVTDYYNIDPQYGTLEDFKNLVSECHKRGIHLIIDFVFNHTSAKHPWFLEAVSYLESLKEGEEPDLEKCPYVGYYHFTKDYNGSKTYYKAGTSNWYYEGVFWDQMPDLALENENVRKEIEDIAKYWLDLGVDGFRLDAAKEYFSGEKERNIEVLKWFSDYVKSVKEDADIVAEVWDEEGTIAAYYESGIPSLFNFPLSQHNGLITNTARKLGTSSGKNFAKTLLRLDEKYKEGNPKYIDAPFISNHDTTRISAQCVNDEDQMKMSAGMLLTMNGSPYVYYGEEIGMNSKGTKDENKRLPMQWSATDTTGITTPPANADSVEQKFPPVDEQMKDPLSLYNYYKRAVRIRNENPEIARGDMSVIEELCTKDISAIKKVYQGSEIVILYNINTESANILLKDAGLTELNIRGYLSVDGNAVTMSDGVVSMPKYSIVILK